MDHDLDTIDPRFVHKAGDSQWPLIRHLKPETDLVARSRIQFRSGAAR